MCVFNSFACRLPYSTIFGGAGSLTKEHFKLINGFSNKFWGWGGEDDDLYNRYMYMCNHYCWFWFLCSPTYFSVTDFFCNMKMIWTAEIQIFNWRYNDHRSGNCNLSNCKYPPPPQKKNGGASTGFEPMASALQLQHSSINFELWRPIHKMGADQFVEFVLTPERNETWRWCELWKDKFLNKDMIVAVVIAIFRQLQIHPPPPKKTNKQTNKFRTSTGFELMAFALGLQCSTIWAMKTHTLGAGQFVEFILSCERIIISSSFKIRISAVHIIFKKQWLEIMLNSHG